MPRNVMQLGKSGQTNSAHRATDAKTVKHKNHFVSERPLLRAQH
jgi:hypothetical protein